MEGLKDMVRFCAAHEIPNMSVNEGWFYNTPYLSERDFIKNDPQGIKKAVDEALEAAKGRGILIRLNSASLKHKGTTNYSDLNLKPKDECFNYYISAVITPEMKVKLCPMSKPVGDLGVNTLEEIWNQDGMPVTNARSSIRNKSLPPTCGYCLDYNKRYEVHRGDYSFVDMQRTHHYWAEREN
jgi:hypothetical protein